MGSGFFVLGNSISARSTASEGIRMDKLHCIQHSHGRSPLMAELSTLPSWKSLSALAADWLRRKRMSPLRLEENVPTDDSAFPLEEVCREAQLLQQEVEPHIDCEYGAESAEFLDAEPGTGMWDAVCKDLDIESWRHEEQEFVSRCEIVLTRDESAAALAPRFAHPRISQESFRSFVFGCAVHMAALSLLIAVPGPVLRGLGGTSDRPVSARLIETRAVPVHDIPSPASANSPASMASLAARHPDAEKEEAREEAQKDVPPEEQPEPLNEENKTESRIAEAPPAQEHVEAVQQKRLENSQDGPHNDSKNKHDSINSAPSVASPERKVHAQAGAEVRAYRDHILSTIYEAAYYPRKALRNLAQGRIMVSFTINRDGSLAHVAIVSPATSKILNEAALKILHKASSHFPPLPATLGKEQVTYVVPIVFKKGG